MLKIKQGMNAIIKILLIVIMIIVIIIVAAAILELPRYGALKVKQRLFLLDREYYRRRKVDGPRTVITLSTIPERVKLMGPTLASILDQTRRVDEICINIPYLSRKGFKYHVPNWLRQLNNVTVHRVEIDEGPATKLLPTLRRERHNPSTRIIAIDDDNIYNSRTIEVLVNTFDHHLHKRNKLVAVTGYGVTLDRHGKLPSVGERVKAVFTNERETDLLQGFSGFLVTPAMFPKEAYEIKDCPPETISVDDIWFSAWLDINRIPIIATRFIYKHMPIINFGEIRLTPALATGENKDFIRDQRVINWFRKNKGAFIKKEMMSV